MRPRLIIISHNMGVRLPECKLVKILTPNRVVFLIEAKFTPTDAKVIFSEAGITHYEVSLWK